MREKEIERGGQGSGMGKPVEEKKRKKKGRPSLLDLQKRNLRLQKQQENSRRNPNPSPNPYLRFPNSSSNAHRRSTRRNPSPQADGGENAEEEEEEEESSGKRREKKLKLVLRLQGNDGSAGTNRSDLDSSGSDSNGDGATPLGKRKIDAVGVGDGSVREKTERHNFASKATDPLQGEPSDSGSTTPLPDKKLLVFILDRLQKKDTYGVYSEPVDPNELPDYHDVIEHPMDFGTVRKRLLSGFYANLEHFEKDVFLICSNAMRYNAPDTIYFRQARSIQELAKKNFENLRQESDDNEPEPKTVRRGRPPSKNTIKRPVGRPPAECASLDFSSDATLANAGGIASDKPGVGEASARTNYGLRNSENSIWMAEHRSERNEDCLGFTKGVASRFGKKVLVLDENRRDTFNQPQPSTCGRESSVLTAFDGEKKQLIPIGLHVEHAYARSLAQFAAKLGPVGWEIATRQIEKVLPPGTKFGRGWVGEQDAPQPYQPPLLSSSPPHPSSQPKTLPSTVTSKSDSVPDGLETPSNNKAVEEGHINRCLPPSVSSSAVPNRSSMGPMEGTERMSGSNHESSFSLLRGNSGGGSSIRPNSPPFQLHQNVAIQPGINGFNPAFGFNLPQVGKKIRPSKPTGNFASDVAVTHARAFNMVSRGNNSFIHPTPATHSEAERPNLSNSCTINSVSTLPNSAQEPQGPSWRGLSLRQRPDSTPPDLNVRFQSPGSPASGGVMVDSQQPDLVLQL